jgi:hypothetical protein
LVLLVVIATIAWHALSNREPSYSGKRLSVWLDELVELEPRKRMDPQAPPVQAVRPLGTNAIPWLMKELKYRSEPWAWRINDLLAKQQFIKYRFPDASKHNARGTAGFEALGELGVAAIPSLLALVEEVPGPVPYALAGIGTPALPALAQCLTNTKSYTTSSGELAPIPGNTIDALYRAAACDRIQLSEVAFLLPTIQMWAQSTNQHAARNAKGMLRDFGP